MIPRRGAVAIVSTVIGLALLLSFKTPASVVGDGSGIVVLGSNPPAPSAPVALAANGSGTTGATSGTTSDPTAPAAATAVTGSTPTPTPAPTDARATKKPKRSTVAATPAPPAATATPAPTPRRTPTSPVVAFSGNVNGPIVQTPFGDVQVRAVISSGKLVDVVALQTPSDRTRSQEIAQYAVPILRSEALAAQSAQINAVSGATYTSEGYAQSLQAALDQAKA